MKTMTQMLIIALGVLVLYVGSLYAGNVTLPYPDFTAGTPAVADQVDANFYAITQEVNDNNTRISTNAKSVGTKQNRVTGTCADGESIRTINDDGTVVCEKDDGGGAGDGHSLDAADGNPENALYVDNNGNVGIGTGAENLPDALTLLSNSERIGIRLDTNTCGNDDNGEARIVLDSSNQLHIFNACSPTSSGIVFDSNGNVGIGTIVPNHKFEIHGDVNIVSGVYRAAGECLIGPCPSDKKLKKNIKPLTNSLEKIAQLEPVSYEFKDTKFGPGEKYGLVAQDLEKVFPEWVTKDPDGNKSIKYGLQFQMLLINAIKELKEKNEKLEAEIKGLKDKI